MVVTEIGLAGAGGDNEGIVGKHLGVFGQFRSDGFVFGINTDDFCLKHADIILVSENLPGGGRDLAVREDTGRHLIQQGLEQVVVRAVNEGDVHVGVFFEVLDGEKSTEAGTNDDNVMATTLGTVGSVSHDNITPAVRQ